MKVLSLFSGIGAFEKAISDLNVDYELTNYCEINQAASRSYSKIHNVSEDLNLWDITTVDTSKLSKDIDLITHGSPCQDFSIAGNGLGGDEGSGTRSSLMYETIRIVKDVKPKIIIWENVKNVLSEKHIHNFNAYVKTLDEFGYNSYHKVLNAKDFNIPQNRERLIVVSVRKDIDNGKFKFPESQKLTLTVKDMLNSDIEKEYYLSEKQLESIKNTNYKRDTYKDSTNDVLSGRYNEFAIMDYRYDEGLRIRKNGLCPTLTTQLGRYTSISGQPIILENNILRFMTELEGFRLMGFKDEDYYKALEVNSKRELGVQAGNSIVVPVIKNVIKSLIDSNILNNKI